MHLDLSGKRAIITGAGAGIGRKTAEVFLNAGAEVYICDIDQDALESAKSNLPGLKGTLCDVSDSEALSDFLDQGIETLGGLDIMVNNAGLETRTSVLDTSPEDYDRVLDVNLKSAFFGTQFAAKQMIKQGGGGRIINISSVHEDWPMPNNTAYCLSKGGVRMLTRTAGVELAPHGITMVNIGPGAVDTPINASYAGNKTLLDKLDAAIPLGRMAEPQEIASVAAFVASDGASYITATSIFADGGIMQSSPGL